MVDALGLPRYWATIWADVLKAGIEDGTRGVYLAAVERLYQSVINQSGDDCLDRMLTSLDFRSVEAALSGFLTSLRNSSAVDGADREATWKYALMFVQDVMRHMGPVADERMGAIDANLVRLDRLYSQIAPTHQKPAAPIRALPAVVIEDLHRLFAPASPDNPFRSDDLRWRNFLIFLVFLHLGLRRGEVLILPVNAVKEDYDPTSGLTRYWMDVDETLDEDSRFDAPSLKTKHSRRQLPVSEVIVALADRVAVNHRFKAVHPFLLSSQQCKPLAIRSANSIFEQVSSALSDRSRKALADRGKTSVTAHDLRHTCAVYRLARYRGQGDDMDTAIEKLRVFFGWSPTSEMPRHYARSYFETSLQEVWEDSYDTFVETIRIVNGAPL